MDICGAQDQRGQYLVGHQESFLSADLEKSFIHVFMEVKLIRHVTVS